MAVTSTTVPPGARSASPCSATSNGPPNSRCCDTGRPLFTDPITGQTVCSCQYDQSIINYQRLASGMGVGGAPGMPLSMYSTPYSAETMAAYFPALGGGDQPPFYPNPVSTLVVSFHFNDLRSEWKRVQIYMCLHFFQHFMITLLATAAFCAKINFNKTTRIDIFVEQSTLLGVILPLQAASRVREEKR